MPRVPPVKNRGGIEASAPSTSRAGRTTNGSDLGAATLRKAHAQLQSTSVLYPHAPGALLLLSDIAFQRKRSLSQQAGKRCQMSPTKPLATKPESDCICARRRGGCEHHVARLGRQYGELPTVLSARLEREVHPLSAGATGRYRLKNLGSEAFHDWGGAHGEFHELILIDRAAETLSLLVAADD